MTDEHAWSTASVSFAAAAGLVLYGLAGPLSGSLMGRLGVKRVVVASLVVTGVALLVSSVVTEIWQLTLSFGLLAGIGTGLVASVLGPTVAARWFVRNRGLVNGIFGASSSAGQLVFIPVLTVLAIAFDWRVAGTFFVCGATSNGLVGQHFIPHAVEHGFTQSAAASALALMGVFNFIGTIASGWLTDRYDPRKLLLMYYGFRGVSLLFLPFVHDTMTIGAFAILFGLDYIATVPPTVALAADRFGAHNVGVVYGWIFAAHMLGAAIAAWVTGVVRESVGDYAVAFVAAGWIAIVAGFAALMIRRREPASAFRQAA